MHVNSREDAKSEFSRLLKYWKEIEFWLKKAEQVNGQALISAINELRYASRQLFNAIDVFERTINNPKPCDLSIIRKRIIVAEQYLLNADNDIADAVVTFYRILVLDLDKKYGAALVTTHFHEYPAFRKNLTECEKLIAESRGDYALRIPNYKTLRDEYFPELIRMYELLVEAEIGVQEEQQRTDRAVKIAQGRASFGFWFGIIMGLGSLAFAFYTWRMSGDRYCQLHGNMPILNLPCLIN